MPLKYSQLVRKDSIIYHIISGGIIGCLVMSMDFHTMAHGPANALLSAAILSIGVSFLSGIVGRLMGILITWKEENSQVIRWLGNIMAFITPGFAITTLALA